MNSRTLCPLMIAVTCSIAAQAGSFKQPPESVTVGVDQLFAEWNRTDSPGCSLAVSRNGTVVYEHGYGMANLELGVPITSASVLPAASISKQFTAMCILLLAQRGELSLDDEVKKLIPDWAYREQPITIRHLLTHTSGLRDAFTLLGLAAPREDDVNVNVAIAKALARQRGLNFAPGAEFQYNNGGYNLLGSIVKRVSGQSLRDFADANIFKPLGMTHTHFHDDPAMLVPNRVSGYSRGESGFRLTRPEGGVVGNAGLYTTPRDLLLWEQNFAEARVGDRALLDEMQKPVVPTGWSDSSYYGFGLEIGKYRGLRTIGHGGGDAGIATYVVRYPEHGIAIALQCNLDNIGPNVGRLTQKVAEIFLAEVLAASTNASAPADPPAILLSAEDLASKVGLYRDASTETVGRIFLRNVKLMASADAGEDDSVELTPVTTNRFIVPGTSLVIDFVPATAERPQELHVTGDGPKLKVSQRVSGFVPSSAELQAFAGEYISPELVVTYKILARESDLLAQMPGRPDVVLRPVFQDAFAGRALNVVKFSRDARRAITGFTVNTTAARGLHFDRVNR